MWREVEFQSEKRRSREILEDGCIEQRAKNNLVAGRDYTKRDSEDSHSAQIALLDRMRSWIDDASLADADMCRKEEQGL